MAEGFSDQYPGFEIKCLSCGSIEVWIENTLGFSAISGSWGEITLNCEDCKRSTEIVSS